MRYCASRSPAAFGVGAEAGPPSVIALLSSAALMSPIASLWLIASMGRPFLCGWLLGLPFSSAGNGPPPSRLMTLERRWFAQVNATAATP